MFNWVSSNFTPSSCSGLHIFEWTYKILLFSSRTWKPWAQPSGIKIEFEDKGNFNEYKISGIENRIQQIIANLLDNSISFTSDNKKILVQIKKDNNENILLKVIDEGQGFKEIDTNKIFKWFYSNRPEKFGEHSGLGLNIVKNLVDLHGGSIKASNNPNQKGANVEIIFPKS